MKYVIIALFAILGTIVYLAANESTPKQQYIFVDAGPIHETWYKDSIGNVVLVDKYIDSINK